ncbi:MAG: rhamnogalacturonan acetylesterase [Tepidisphaeraceae bacterium]
MNLALKRRRILGALVPVLTALAAGTALADSPRQFVFGTGPAPEGATRVTADTTYTPAAGFGLEPGAGVASSAAGLTGTDFLFSVKVPEGNYRVTITLGDPNADSDTAVKAESRRVVFPLTHVAKGQTRQLVATLNTHTPRIDDQSAVHVLPREMTAAIKSWDDKLTLEFLGKHAAVQGVTIEKDDHAITLFIAGDSTVTDQPVEPWAAWGQLLPQFFNSNVAVANYAESGRTLRSFKGDLRWAKILSQVKPGDYVFIQFGHNDMKETGPGVGPYTTFSQSLRNYIDDVKARKATPVVITPMHRRRFKGNEIQETFGDYPDAIRKVAWQEGVTLIDLHEMSKPLYEAFGPDKSTQLFVHFPANSYPGQTKALKDDTHFRAFGADQIARCIVQGIRDQKLPIAADIREDVPTFDPSKPNDPAKYDLPESKPSQIVKPEGS